MGRSNKICPPALTSVTAGREGTAALTTHPPGQQVEQIEHLSLPRAGM